MHGLFRKKGWLLAGVAALVLSAISPSTAVAKPQPGAKGRGFRLFARALGAFTINRVYLGLSSTGEVGVDSSGSSVVGGGFWPKGTGDQYVFNSGLQGAGIIDPSDPTNPWHGDTTGFFFFDPKGTTQHGEEIQPVFNANNPADAGAWPAAALVPQGDANEQIFNPLLRGRVSASQGDVWWLTWDGNPSLNAGRKHPLGVLVEQRGMGWNFPSGNEDIAYFIYTFYNITSTNAADYAAVRPSMQPILLQAAAQFQALNNAKFGITLPANGYSITNFYANFSADMDVGSAGVNYSSVNVPFALGYVYQHDFAQPAGWLFDPSIFSAPLFAGVGFVGVKYLKSPVVNGVPVGLTMFSNTINGGAFGDPQNTIQLYRYVSGNINTAAGDAPCNTGNQLATKICYVNNTAPNDMRFFQSSGPLTLPPGSFGSVVVAYEFAGPVAPNPNCNGNPNCIKPGNPTVLSNPAVLNSTGANKVDSLSGYAGFTDLNADGIVQQNEMKVVPGSLLGKSLVAQAVFDNGFLLPFAPDAPQFFLIPGDNQVTVLWRPSPSEITGDPFFAIASNPIAIDPITNQPGPNALYDPNYRQFDVEGYRVYRGRVDAPNSLQLLAQFDYSGTTISDFQGQVNFTPNCAPELGVKVVQNCPAVFDPVIPGVARTVHVDIPLVGQITQVKLGQRTALGDSTAIALIADTALTGGGSRGPCAPSACPVLKDNGVPFVFVDLTPKNNFRYFYSVTAFDVNSFQSGPSSIESPRNTKSVTPVRPATNFQNTATITSHVVGRGVAMDTIVTTDPTIDPVTGKFSGRFKPADGATLGFVGQFVKTVIAAPGALAVTLDSMDLGSSYDGIANTYYVTAQSGPDITHLSVALVQTTSDATTSGSTLFDAISIDNALASRFGGNGSFKLKAQAAFTMAGNYHTETWGRGCINGAAGFTSGGGCDYNGTRWFDGPSPATNETLADPNGNNQGNSAAPAAMVSRSNAGALTGVDVIYEPHAYLTTNNTYRDFEGSLGGAARQADFNLYWGAGGKVDSVIDVTHNVPVPFDSLVMRGGWGILNSANTVPSAGSFDNRAEVSTTDFSCVQPLKSYAAVQSRIPCPGPTYVLTQTAVPGPVAIMNPTNVSVQTNAAEPTAGFALWLAGHVYSFDLTGGAVPAAGAVWSMRSYIGAVTGGNGSAGNEGPYAFFQATRDFTALGAQLQIAFNVVNQSVAPTKNDLTAVHTVPDPYYVTSAFESSTDNKVIKFVNLPIDAIIRIYSSSGVLVNLIEHHSTTFGGDETWNVRNRNNQVVASGVYFYHIEAGDARRVGRFTVVNFAQ
ncbi:MAG: hypothetical protein ABJD11_10265 [Gemmatimonadota bacterium]